MNSGQLLHFSTRPPPRPAHHNNCKWGSSSKAAGAPPPRFTSEQTNFRWSYMRLRPTCSFISHSYAELWRMLNSNLNKGGLIAIKLAPSQERSGAEPSRLSWLSWPTCCLVGAVCGVPRPVGLGSTRCQRAHSTEYGAIFWQQFVCAH